MIEKLDRSSGEVVGYKVVGKVTAEDYDQLEPEIRALVEEHDSDVRVLIDLQEFAGEEVRAWLPDLKFGHRFHDDIAKMAIVGDKRWQEWMTMLVDPFYSRDAKFFDSDQIDAAWTWLQK
jgi:hypothetical protein